MSQIRLGSVASLAPIIREMASAHWSEVEAPLGVSDPEPLIDGYAALERGNALIAMGAHDENTGKLIGYATAIVVPNLHSGVLFAQSDLLYVAPAHRGRFVGLRLMRAIEKAAKARGARWMLFNAKPGTELEGICERAGYEREEIVYRRVF